jgi:para-nitrobenzyl esterase
MVSAHPRVELRSGWVAGRLVDGVASFLGIPYAAPPSGGLRWRPPQPVASWAGVREAFEPGPIAPQPPPAPGASLPGDPTAQDEDCLRLNVWTPSTDGSRPVMVWIHGGGFSSGTGASRLFRGDLLARRGDVVVVTVNYRLGALGFLAHPCLVGEDGGVGNYGLLDQIAALRWVHEHIGSFGGDASNVTVFGESAGAMSIGCLMASPAARGLFRRAVMESGPPYTHSRERAFEGAHDLVGRAGIDVPTRAALEAIPPEVLVRAQQDMQAEAPRPGELNLPLLPTVDGRVLIDEPRQVVAGGAGAECELIIGTNRDEMAFFALSMPQVTSIDADALVRWVARSAPHLDAADAVATFRVLRAERGLRTDPWHLWVAMHTDIVFALPSVALANAHAGAHATFLYLFEWSTPIFDGSLGACHGLEIPFVFGCHREPAVAPFVGGDLPGADELADALQGAWLGFASAGNPTHEAIGEWEPWDPKGQATMVFSKGGALHFGPRRQELEAWAQLEGSVTSTNLQGA